MSKPRLAGKHQEQAAEHSANRILGCVKSLALLRSAEKEFALCTGSMDCYGGIGEGAAVATGARVAPPPMLLQISVPKDPR